MNYFLLKLAFDTAVHFGGSDSAVGSQSSALTLRADTIFSALCHTALEVYGEPALEELLISADADALRISDAMPWRGNSFYLPKPIAASTSPAELSTVERKAVKKLAWIPASKFDRYTASLHSGTYPLDELDQSFGQAYEQTKASVTDGADAKPYFVGLYRLHAGCGLYVLCACEGNDQLKMLKELFTLLGLSGIGGRTSAGYGRFHLDGIPAAPRGVPQIEVTFDIDANGILNVSAKDKGTGKEQNIRIEASSGLTEQEIQRMRDEAKANEARDREEREKVDKVNAADTLIFSTEKQLKEYGDKIPADKKANIESALAELKAAHAAGNVADIDSATTRLNDAWQAASQDMYSAQQQAGGAQQGAQDAGTQHGTPNNAGGNQNDGGVTDVEFEEVK